MLNSRTERTNFHSGVCTIRLSLLLMLLHKLTSFEVQRSTRTSLSFFALTLCGLSQDQSWPLVATIRQYETEFLKADNNKINITSSQGKVISHNPIHNYIHCFSNDKLCNMCYYVNPSSSPRSKATWHSRSS